MLSEDDCCNEDYGFSNDTFEDDSKRIAVLTDYAKAHGGFFVSEKNTAHYLQKSPFDFYDTIMSLV